LGVLVADLALADIGRLMQSDTDMKNVGFFVMQTPMELYIYRQSQVRLEKIVKIPHQML